MQEENRQVVLGCWGVANTHDASGFDKYYREDVVYHGNDGEIRGRDNVKAYLQTFLTALPDIKLTVEDIFGEGDRVFSRARLQGTNTGEFNGMPPTGKSIDVSWIDERLPGSGRPNHRGVGNPRPAGAHTAARSGRVASAGREGLAGRRREMAMTTLQGIKDSTREPRVSADRKRMLQGFQVEERILDVGGIATSVLECGQGHPLVLLHGGIECGGVYWAPVIPQLARTDRLDHPRRPGAGRVGARR